MVDSLRLDREKQGGRGVVDAEQRAMALDYKEKIERDLVFVIKDPVECQ